MKLYSNKYTMYNACNITHSVNCSCNHYMDLTLHLISHHIKVPYLNGLLRLNTASCRDTDTCPLHQDWHTIAGTSPSRITEGIIPALLLTSWSRASSRVLPGAGHGWFLTAVETGRPGSPMEILALSSTKKTRTLLLNSTAMHLIYFKRAEQKWLSGWLARSCLTCEDKFYEMLSDTATEQSECSVRYSLCLIKVTLRSLK